MSSYTSDHLYVKCISKAYNSIIDRQRKFYMSLHKVRTQCRQRPPTYTLHPFSIATMRNERCRRTNISFLLCLLLLAITTGPYYTLHSPRNVAIILYVDGWKIGNLFQRHRGNNNDSDDGYKSDHIFLPNDDNDNFVTAPSISPTAIPETSNLDDSSPGNPHATASSHLDTATPAASLLSILRQSFQIPIALIQKLQEYYDVGKEQIWTIVCYHPPVGMVSIFLLLRFLVRTKRYLFVNHGENSNDNIEDRLFLQKLQQRDKRYYNDRNQRAYLFNQDDVAYHTYGGIERIRTRLCLASLLHSSNTANGSSPPIATGSSSMYNTTSSDDSAKNEQNEQWERHKLQKLLIQSLSVSSLPNSGSSWIQYIYDMILPLAQVEQQYDKRSTPLRPNPINTAPMGGDNVDDSILAISLMTGKVRLHDSLLRLCRDRVLQTTYRLARTVEHWERRMRYNTRRGTSMIGGSSSSSTRSTVSNWLLYKIFRIQHSMENDRLCLSLAKAAYTMEVSRLGEITALLMERPHEMESSHLIYALKATEQRRQQQRKSETMTVSVPQTTTPTTSPTVGSGDNPIDTNAEPLNEQRGNMFRKFRTIIPSTLRHFSKYSFRWKADGKGFLSIRRFDNNSDGYIDGESANNVLLQDQKPSASVKQSSNEASSALYSDIWMSQANDWIHQVKSLICQVIRESLQATTSKSLPNDCSEEDFDILQNQWFRNDKNDLTINLNTSADESTHGMIRNREQQYRTIVNYIDSSTTWRRIGEGEKIRLRDVFGMNDWMTRLDLLGIPSSIVIIYLAHTLHTRIVVPYWSTIRQSTIEISRKAFEILEQRVWVPLKGIYDDIMNRSPSMMSALGLDIEETSLDRMLQDLNFGDGTPATRQEAIKKATEQYEHDLSHGLFANFARGRLIRLLLIQVQQLKVGMLSALETIDVLIVGNRIHFKVLAAIPAILIASYGTRYFFRGLYNIRAKDIRPISAVHNEMTQYLNKMEKILLLSNPMGNLNQRRKEAVERNKITDGGQRGGTLNTVRARTKVPLSSATPSTVPDSYTKQEQRAVTNFSPLELGEMILNTHRYLILLDFSSPQPFPTNQCDEIHASLQQYYNNIVTNDDDHVGSSMIQQMDPTRQVQWLHTIQQKHQELMKFL